MATLLTFLFALFVLVAPARATPTFPLLTGRVVDDAHVLAPDVQADLTSKLASLEAKTGTQLVVVTLPSLQGDDIADYGYQLGRAWGIGQKGKNTGALFIIAPAEKKTRIEVGYGLEGVLTDAMSSVILNSQVLPRFRQGDVPGGVVAGTDAIIQQLGLDPATAQAQAQQAAAVQAQQESQPQGRHHELVGSIFSFLLFVFVISAFFRGGRRGGGLGWALPLMFLGGGGFGGRDNDDGGGFGGGGGGFSGGGGSFGGGGASGAGDMLSEADHARIATAVGAAEARTTGEIVCILAREVSSYREVPLSLAAAVALIGPPLALLAGAPAEALTPWARDWSAGAAPAVTLTRALEAYGLLQVVLFAVTAALASIPAVRRILTPAPLKRHRVHKAALQQFLATGLHLEAGRTGVVIFASQHDRRVELLADDAIHAAVGDVTWNAAIAAVQAGMKRGRPADGYIRAVELCGEALAQHFPSQGPHESTISDRLLEI